MPSGIPLGPYILKRKLARGGMAEIFLARKEGPEGFARDLVVKRMLPHLTADPELSALFRAEARIVARMNHPNVVHVYDFGEEGGTGYLVMELVRGVDLRALTERAAIVARRSGRRGAVPARHAAKLLSFVCEGLAHAHSLRGEDNQDLGVVHRDVTPSNVLVSFDGAVKVADFGVAKLATHGRDDAIRGKFAYLSPEQARGEAIDGRSDLYNVGILLYETITGEALFPHDNPMLAKSLAAGGKVPDPERLKDLGVALESVARRALSADPNERYPDALAMRADLEQYLRRVERPSDSVEIGRYVRALFPDVLAEDRRGPRAAGTVVTGGGTAPMTEEGFTDIAPTTPSMGLDASPPPVPQPKLPLPVAPPATRSRRIRVGLALLALTLLAAGVGFWASSEPATPTVQSLSTVPAAATLAVSTDPPGLPLYVDGVDMGRGPLTFALAPGPHHVQARMGEQVVAERSIVLEAGDETTVVLAGALAELRVASDPTGATVLLDGEPIGETPLSAEQPPALRQLELRAEGFEPHVRLVRFVSGDVTEVSVTLRPVPEVLEVAEEPSSMRTMRARTPQGRGTLVLATTPWSTVYEGSRRLGITPLRVELSAGRHVLSLRAEGRAERRRVVQIREGEETRVREAL